MVGAIYSNFVWRSHKNGVNTEIIEIPLQKEISSIMNPTAVEETLFSTSAIALNS